MIDKKMNKTQLREAAKSQAMLWLNWEKMNQFQLKHLKKYVEFLIVRLMTLWI